jgi:hypothetical protein
MIEQLTSPEQSEFVFYGLERIDRTKPKWHSTAALFRRHRPAEHRIAVELLAAGKHSMRELERLLHVSHHTLEAVQDEQRIELATLREKAARRNMHLHHMSLDRLEELLPKMENGKDVAVVVGITADKAQNFAGEATARIEIIEPISIVDRFRLAMLELEKRVAERIGCEAKKTLANRASSPGFSAGRDPLEIEATVTGSGPETDLLSSGLQPICEESATDPPNLPNNQPLPGDSQPAKEGRGRLPRREAGGVGDG